MTFLLFLLESKYKISCVCVCAFIVQTKTRFNLSMPSSDYMFINMGKKAVGITAHILHTRVYSE